MLVEVGVGLRYQGVQEMYTCCLHEIKSKNAYPSQVETSLWRMLPGQGCCGALGLSGVGARFGRQ